jgi:diacylglycerol kinase (ATP)
LKTCIIFNPAARGDKARGFQAHLAEIERECTLKPTTHAGAARTLAAEAIQQGFETIVAAGGDGTVNEVLNGIGDGPNSFEKIQLGILPLGTTNVFAKELRIPIDFGGAWEVIRRNKEMQIDAPYASYAAEGKPCRRYFAQMAGAGLDSRAIELVGWEQKKRLGWFAYVVAGLKALTENLPNVCVSNGRDTARGQLVLIGNGKFYGGRFNVFPLADMADGVLEAVIYPTLNPETVARACWGMATGDFHTGDKTVQLQGDTIEVTTERTADGASTGAPLRTIPFHLDGENVAPLPVTFSVKPRALRVLVP